MSCNPRLPRRVLLPSQQERGSFANLKFLELCGLTCPVKQSDFEKKTIDILYKLSDEKDAYSILDMYNGIRKHWSVLDETKWAKLKMPYEDATDFEKQILKDPNLIRRIQYTQKVPVMHYESVGTWHMHELVSRFVYWLNDQVKNRCKFHGIVQVFNSMKLNLDEVKRGVPSHASYIQSFSDVMNSIQNDYMEYEIHLFLIEEKGNFMTVLIQTGEDGTVIEFVDPKRSHSLNDKYDVMTNYMESLVNLVRKKENEKAPQVKTLPRNLNTSIFRLVPLSCVYILLRLYHCQCMETYYKHPSMQKGDEYWFKHFFYNEGKRQFINQSLSSNHFRLICIDLMEFVTNIRNDEELKTEPNIEKACSKFINTVSKLVHSKIENNPLLNLNSAVEELQRSFHQYNLMYLLPPNMILRLIANYQNDPIQKLFERNRNPEVLLNQILKELFQEKTSYANPYEYGVLIMKQIFIKTLTPLMVSQMSLSNYMLYLIQNQKFDILSALLKYIHYYNVENKLKSSTLINDVILSNYQIPSAATASKVWQRIRDCQAIVNEIEILLHKYTGMKENNVKKRKVESKETPDTRPFFSFDNDLKRLIVSHQVYITHSSAFTTLTRSGFPVSPEFYLNLTERSLPESNLGVPSTYFPKLLQEIPYMRFYAIGIIVATASSLSKPQKRTQKISVIVASLLEFFSYAETPLMKRLLCELMHQVKGQVESNEYRSFIKREPFWNEFTSKLNYCQESISKPELYDTLHVQIRTLMKKFYA